MQSHRNSSSTRELTEAAEEEEEDSAKGLAARQAAPYGRRLTSNRGRGVECFQHGGELVGELGVEAIHEDVLHATVLKQMLRRGDGLDCQRCHNLGTAKIHSPFISLCQF